MMRRSTYHIRSAGAAACLAACIALSPAAAQEKPIAPLIEIMSRPQVPPPQKTVPPQTKPVQQPLAQKGLPALETLSPTAPKELQTAPEKTIAPEQNPAQSAEQPKRKIPTLREQMQNVESLQSEQLTSTEDLRKEIREVKRSVEDLRRTVEESLASPRKNLANKSNNKNLPDAINDAPEIKPKRNNKRTEETEENVILPDGGKSAPKTKTTPLRTQSTEPKSAPNEDKSSLKPAATSPPTTAAAEQPAPNGYREAMNLIAKKKYGDAVPLLQQTLQSEKTPESQSSCYYWLGESYYGLGKFDEAIKHFQKVGVLRSSTKLDDAQIMIAESYYRKGDLAEAKNAFRRLIDVYPKSEYVARAKKMLQEL